MPSACVSVRFYWCLDSIELNHVDIQKLSCNIVSLEQWSSNLAREIHFPAEFSSKSNPNQTHLSMLISVFRIIRRSQVGEFDQGWS